MKLVTYNINGINKRISNLLEWLSESKPDIVCLQELKASQASFPEGVLRQVGYESVWLGEPAWNGVAILSRGSSPVLTRSTLPGDPTDGAVRYIEAAVNGVLVGCLYAPNGNPQPGPKFDYKLRWLDRLAKHADELIRSGLPVVLAGDFNVVPEATDIYVTTSTMRWSSRRLAQRFAH